jgi:hypothetical protein
MRFNKGFNMKKAVIFALMVFSISSATALVGHNGSNQSISITADQDVNNSQPPYQNPKEYTINFESIRTPSNNTGISSSEFNDTTLELSAIIDPANNCGNINTKINETSDSVYRVSVLSFSAAGPNEVIQCDSPRSYRTYNLTFSHQEPFKILLFHEDRNLDNFTHPDFEPPAQQPSTNQTEDKAQDKTDQRQQGLIQAFSNLLTNLF